MRGHAECSVFPTVKLEGREGESARGTVGERKGSEERGEERSLEEG